MRTLPTPPPLVGRALLALAVMALGPRVLGAQASPFVMPDDPDLPFVEYLITRGDLADPAPLVRPFQRAELRAWLAKSDTVPFTPSGKLIGDLATAYGDPSAKRWWRVQGQAGGQAYSYARRDAFHPSGSGGVSPYADVQVSGIVGPVIGVVHPALEPRLDRDPDWRGSQDVARFMAAYVGAQFRWASLYYGYIDQNWGPQSATGIPISNYGYGRPVFNFRVATRDFALTAFSSDLRTEIDSTGQSIQRYFVAHRVGIRLSNRFQFGLWETTVLQGEDRSFDARFRNPVTLLLLANTYGYGGALGNNIMLGFDFHWRVARAVTLEGQLAIDDLVYQDRGSSTRNPDRWALALTAFGPIASRLAWRALYTQASSMVFRAFNPHENYLDAGVGIGRNFPDNDQTSVFLSVLPSRHWLITPEFSFFRQGEGRLTDPYPPKGTARGNTPQIFIGVVEQTYRAALGVTGAYGPIRLTGNAGFHHLVNANNVQGTDSNLFIGRLQVTLALGAAGVF